MIKKGIFTIILLLSMTLCYIHVFAAVGCSLNDPERDIKRIFLKYTGYKTQFITIKERGGKRLLTEIEKKLRDKFDPVHEAPDVPYAYYTVLKGTVTIGRIHGVNQKGKYGGMQLILATDLEGRIIKFYYQRISSPEAKKFKVSSFTGQFKNLTLSDFYRHDVKHPDDKIAKIKDPSKKSYKDFKATLRGIKKNLILLDIFFLNRRYDKDHKILQKKKKNYRNIGKEESMKALKIKWQRLVDESGQTCERCEGTEKQVEKAFYSLKQSLAPLGIKVTLEKKALDPATCAKDVSLSNRIWVGGRILEEWVDGQVGKSLCGFCCAELGDDVECRTIEVDGKTYETIPAELIIKAGLLAVSDISEVSTGKSCCEQKTKIKRKTRIKREKRDEKKK